MEQSIKSEYKASLEVAAVDIPLEVIFSDSNFNCRGNFISEDVAELANDIRERGVLQPIIVQVFEEDGYQFKIVAGHRRFAACQRLNRKMIPAIVKQHITDLQAKALNLVENIQRKDLNIVQEANALKGLQEAGLRQSAMADYLGVSMGWIQPRIWLLDLPVHIQQEAAAGFLNQTHIRDLHRMPLISQMEEAVARIKEAKYRNETISIAPRKHVSVIQQKKVRGITDLTTMQTAIRVALGNNLTTRCIAWAIGAISDLEMYSAIKEEADAKGINFEIPKEFTTDAPTDAVPTT